MIQTSSVAPSVTHLNSDAGVTGLAKAHEVAVRVSAALTERQDVMYFLGDGDSGVLLALLAQRVGFDVSVTDTFPSTTVAFVGLGVALVLVVLGIGSLLMFFTVNAVCKLRAAWVAARPFRFCRHDFLLFGQNKSPEDYPPRLACIDFYSLIISESSGGYKVSNLFKSAHFSETFQRIHLRG